MKASIPTFGIQLKGQNYIRRPGVYAVIVDEVQKIAVIEYKKKFYLPGGGLNEGETWEQGLQREVREEVGRAVKLGAFLGTAREFVYAEEEEKYYEKVGQFYTASFLEQVVATTEHKLQWLAATDADWKMGHASHLWAIIQVVG